MAARYGSVSTFCSLYNIITYVKEDSRPIIEGEAVLNAGHVVMCRVNAENGEKIIGLCQQASNLMVGLVHVSTCKAGAGGKCKHIVACSLFINRSELEQLNCTDLQQAWGRLV